MFGTRGVAESYTRLIEFKVKDGAIKAATERLFKSLDRIEKKLDQIGGKGGKGFTQVGKGADKAAASLKRLQATSTGVAKASGVVRASIVGLGAGLVAANAGVTALDQALRKTSVPFNLFGKAADISTGKLLAHKATVLGAAAAHPALTGAIIAGVGAYTLFGSKIFNVKKQLTGFVANVNKAKKAVREFIFQTKVPKDELTIFDRIQSAKGGGLVGLKKLLDQVTAAQSKLISTNLGYVSSSEKVRAVEKALNAELMARKRIMDQIIISEQARTPTSTLTAAAGQAGGLEGLRQLLSEAQGIQDRMLTTNENYKVASARVRNIQKAINAELERRDKIMGKVNAKEQKSVTLGEKLRGLAGNLGGKAVQAARPGRAIERRGLIAGGVGGMAGLGMASNTAIGGGLGWLGSKTMEAAGGIAGAGAKIGIPGMGLASKGIADTSAALKGLVVASKGVAAANVMNPAFVAALGAAWVIFGNKGIRGAIEKLIGAERAAKKTTAGLFKFAKANPIFSRLNMELEISKDAMKQLGDVAEKTKREVAALQDPGMKDRVARNLRASRVGRESSGFADWSDSTTTRLSAIKSLERKNKRLVKQGKERLKGERLITKEVKKQIQEKNRLATREQESINRQVQRMFTPQKRRERRGGARVRMMGSKMGLSGLTGKSAENLMLGAGFPLLFGGGIGAVGGGLGGSAIGNALGMGGFGTQIIGSAIGTQLDNLVMKAKALGDALANVGSLDMTALEDSGIRINANLTEQVNDLKRIGKLTEARALLEKEVLKNTGAYPSAHRNIKRTIDDLDYAWKRVSTSVGTLLAVLSDPFLSTLGTILDVVNETAKLFNVVATTGDRMANDIFKLLGLEEAIATAKYEQSDAGKQALEDAKDKFALTEKEIKLQKKIKELTFQKSSGKTHKERLENINIDYAIARANIRAERETMESDLLKSGIPKGGKAYNMRMKNIDAKIWNKIQTAKGERDHATGKEITDHDADITKRIKNYNKEINLLEKQLGIKGQINKATEKGNQYAVSQLEYDLQGLDIRNETQFLLEGETNLRVRKNILILQGLKLEALSLDKTKQLTEAEQQLEAVFDSIGVSIRDGLVAGLNAAIDGTQTLGEVASNVFKRISNALLNYGVNVGLSSLPGGIGEFFKGALGMQGMAKGGPVLKGTPYVVGERGPELFVPNSSGNIVPNHEMGGANVVVNVDASGSSVEGDAGQAEQLGSMLGAAVQAEIARQQRPGGLLARR